MGIRVIHVMTHDSSGSAKTAPPISRSSTWRRCGPFPTCWCSGPGDAVETAEAWDCALQAETSPSVLSCPGRRCRRFVMRPLTPTGSRAAPMCWSKPPGHRDVTLIATGLEVSIALEAATLLAADQVQAAVVSAPA